MSFDIEKTVLIGLSSYFYYHSIKFLIPGDMNLTVSRETLAIAGTIFAVTYSSCPYFINKN
jgi:hypothetical protein